MQGAEEGQGEAVWLMSHGVAGLAGGSMWGCWHWLPHPCQLLQSGAGPSPSHPALGQSWESHGQDAPLSLGKLCLKAQLSLRLFLLLMVFFLDTSHTFCEIWTLVIANVSLLPLPQFALATAEGKPETTGKELWKHL